MRPLSEMMVVCLREVKLKVEAAWQPHGPQLHRLYDPCQPQTQVKAPAVPQNISVANPLHVPFIHRQCFPDSIIISA